MSINIVIFSKYRIDIVSKLKSWYRIITTRQSPAWFLVSLPSYNAYSLIAWNFSLKIAAKLLQMDTRLPSTAYRMLPAPYSIVPSPISRDLLFSHNTAQLACSGLWLFKVIQSQWLTYHLKANMRLPISEFQPKS